MLIIKIDKNEVADIEVKDNKVKSQDAVADQTSRANAQQKQCCKEVNEKLEQRKFMRHGVLANHGELKPDDTPYIKNLKCQ